MTPNHSVQGKTKADITRQSVEVSQQIVYTFNMTAKKSHKTVSARTDRLKAAADYGIDIGALIENIKRSPTERIRRHNIALNTIEELRKAKQL